MNTIADRIKLLLPLSGHTGVSLATAIGYAQSSFSEVINEKKAASRMAVDTFMKMCHELLTTPEYLFYGTGEAMNEARTGKEAQLLMLFRQVGEDKRELLLDILKTAAHSGNEESA